MGPKDGMGGRREIAPHLSDFFFRNTARVHAAQKHLIVVHGASPLELRLCRVIELVVGRFHIGKQCIPAHVWDFDRTKDRAKRRLITPSHVRVPNVNFGRPLSIVIEVNNFRV